MDPPFWDDLDKDFWHHLLKAIERQSGPQRYTAAGEAHEDWRRTLYDMGWQYGENYSVEHKRHPHLVPYAELGQLERDKDAVFLALCEIARLYIREPGQVVGKE
jgi:hypothetical protein